jgi:hypothetical protein
MDNRILELALEMLEQKKSAIDAQINTLRAMQVGKPVIADDKAPGPKERKGKTAAERRAVSLRMKAYWAGRREAKGSAPASAKKPA